MQIFNHGAADTAAPERQGANALGSEEGVASRGRVVVSAAMGISILSIACLQVLQPIFGYRLSTATANAIASAGIAGSVLTAIVFFFFLGRPERPTE